MRVRARCVAAAVALALLVPASLGGADAPASRFEREVRELLASPTPLAGEGALGDEAAWRADVPVGVCVRVTAHEAGLAPFSLRASDGDALLASPNPALDQSLLLPASLATADAWTITVDPVVGGPVDVHVTFDGHAADCGNAPAAFSLSDLPRPPPCLAGAGACLP